MGADPLYEGAERGNCYDVQKACLVVSSPNVHDGKQITALINFEDIVNNLFRAGASIDRANKQGETALIRVRGAGREFTVIT